MPISGDAAFSVTLQSFMEDLSDHVTAAHNGNTTFTVGGIPKKALILPALAQNEALLKNNTVKWRPTETVTYLINHFS